MNPLQSLCGQSKLPGCGSCGTLHYGERKGGGTPMPRNRTQAVHNDGARDPRLVEVGARIKQARLQLNLDQKDLAEIVGVTEKSVSNWEKGLFSPHRKIPELAAALGTSETWLWQGAGAQPDTDQLVQVLESNTRLLRAILDELRLLRLDRTEGRGSVPG